MGWLAVDGVDVALLRSGRDLPEHHAPRPYLHPVRTLGGWVVSEAAPVDHPHHLGLSLAIADINGTSFWGGPSYVQGQGYVMLANHGRQRGPSPRPGPEGVDLVLQWVDLAGTVLLTEVRRLAAHRWDDGWALHWRSQLTATREVVIGSPATRGRAGAGYGGLFWRLSEERPTRVSVDEGDGVQVAHGSTSPWLGLEQQSDLGGRVSLLLLQTGAERLPWFVRTEGYVGAGPAMAWSRPRLLAPGEVWDLKLVVGVLDRELMANDVALLADHVAAHQISGDRTFVPGE